MSVVLYCWELYSIWCHLPSGADEVSGESWWLITAIDDEGDDGLTLC
jgi:hypothetical protein